MKKFLMLSLLLTTSAFAQMEFNVEKVTFSKMVYVSQLSCVTTIGTSGFTYTELRQNFNSGHNQAIVMNHEDARLAGCDQDALQILVENSSRRFGFVTAKVTVKKSTGKNPWIVNGQCVRKYHEMIEIDFGQGTVLETSEIGKLISAEFCN